MRTTRTTACLLLSMGGLLLAANASASLSEAICVPWQGDVNKQHTVIAGVPVTVKAVIKATSTATIYYKIVFGDGVDTGILSISGNTWYTVEAAHTYAGSIGTPFTGQLIASDDPGLATPMTSTYLLKMEDNALDARINVGIDNGLWYLYKQGTRGDGLSGQFLTYDGQPIVYWSNGGYHAGPTASAVQAFEINGSKESGDFNKDPYAEYVAMGLKFLIMAYVQTGCTTTATDNGVKDLTGNGVPKSITLDMLNAQCGSGGTFELFLNGISLGTFVNSAPCSCTPGYQHLLINDPTALATAWNLSSPQTIRVTYTGGAAGAYNSRTDVTLDWGGGNVAALCVSSVPTTCFGDNLCDGYVRSPNTFDVTLNLSSVDTFTVTRSCTGNPILRSVSPIPVKNGTDNPDSNGNGIGIETYDAASARPIYQGGMVMDALIASGTPTKSSMRDFIGNGHIHTYGEIIQDMIDMYASGEYNSTGTFNTDTQNGVVGILGGWRYNWGDFPDNSACQWAAIGMIPAQQAPWNATVPAWVKTYNENWLWYSFSTDNGGNWGHFGYTGTGFIQPDYHGDATTPSGLVQLVNDGDTTSDSRWVRVQRWFSDNWDSNENWLNNVVTETIYPAYSFAKAMRLAQPSPVVTFNSGALSGFDWYRGNSTDNGLAKVVSDQLVANSDWTATYWEGVNLGTAWAVIILKPTLFAASPIACFTAHPNPGFSGLPIKFDPSCSGHSDPAKTIANLVKFDWNWGDGSADTVTATPGTIPHSFACATLPATPCAYQVTLTVTDDAGLTATFAMTINITNPPHPPVSNPGGPYIVSLCAGDTLTLDGSLSFSPDQGLHETTCPTCPGDTITAWDWALKGAPFIYTDAHGETVGLGSGFTSFFPSAGSYNIGLQVTDNAGASYPTSGAGNLKDQEFTTVTVYNSGPCSVTATPGCNSVTLSWNDVTASSYDIYRSSTGPNAGFGLVGSTSLLTLTDNTAATGSYWYRILAHTANGLSMSGAISAQTTSAACVCVTGLTTYIKSLLVQLGWTPVNGASCYNVYRSTAPGVALVPGNLQATCITTPFYADRKVVNGTKYYYVVTEVVNGTEVCLSAEINGTPHVLGR